LENQTVDLLVGGVLDKSLEPLGNKGSKVTMGKNKGSQQREYLWHPLSPGRPLFPVVCCSLLEIGDMFLKSFSGIMNDP
jgi:hypothetical protein